jgi:hypothetical protein
VVRSHSKARRGETTVPLSQSQSSPACVDQTGLTVQFKRKRHSRDLKRHETVKAEQQSGQVCVNQHSTMVTPEPLSISQQFNLSAKDRTSKKITD